MLSKFGTQEACFCSDAENIPDNDTPVKDAVSQALTTVKGALFLYICGVPYNVSCPINITLLFIIFSVLHT